MRTQILYVVGLSWVGAAAKLGQSQIVFWLAANTVGGVLYVLKRA